MNHFPAHLWLLKYSHCHWHQSEILSLSSRHPDVVDLHRFGLPHHLHQSKILSLHFLHLRLADNLFQFESDYLSGRQGWMN